MLRYAIGDVHGCVLQLGRALKWVQQDASRRKREDWQVVMLGDYVDRGPASKEVIEMLCQHSLKFPGKFVFILGNHDYAFRCAVNNDMFDFNGWINGWGGSKTMASYDNSVDNVPQHHRDFLNNLLPFYEAPSHIFVHGGLAPGVPLSEQSEAVVIWNRDHENHGQAKLQVHGHTPTRSVKLKQTSINLDLACVFDGNLAVGVFDDDQRAPLHVELFQGLEPEWARGYVEIFGAAEGE